MDNTKQSIDKEQLVFDPQDVKRASDFVSLYINSTRFGYTKWDVQMICGRITVTMDKTQNPIEELAVIAMSPEHAKAVLIALTVNIKSYEDEHGEIIIPKDKPETKEKEVLASASRRKKK